MRYQIFIVLLGVVLGTAPVSGQTLKAYITAAENAMAEEDYFTAYTHFETAVNVDSSRMDLQYKLAEAARHYYAYSNAEKLYQNVMLSEDGSEYSLAAYWLAKMQQVQGKYDQALTNYCIFVSEQPEADSMLLADAQFQIASSEWAMA